MTLATGAQKLYKLVCAVLVAGGVAALACAANAQAISSSSYQIAEDFIGGGGNTNSSSTSYRADESIGGAAGVGGASGTIFGSQTGAQTPSEPTLSFSVDTANVSLG